jgi:hypothetical protein
MSDEHVSKGLDFAGNTTALRRRRTPFVLCLLALTGTGLLALAPGSRAAEEASTEQSVEASINPEVSWGSAEGCVQNIQTNNFGVLTPEATTPEIDAFDASPESVASIDGSGNHVWVGCVTTNTGLESVTAQGLRNMSSSGDELPLSDVYIGLTNASKHQRLDGGFAGCVIKAGQQTPGACSLPTGGLAETLLTEADPGTTELDWQYQLELPANQAVGSYSGGEVVFTATAGEAPTRGGAPS